VTSPRVGSAPRTARRRENASSRSFFWNPYGSLAQHAGEGTKHNAPHEYAALSFSRIQSGSPAVAEGSQTAFPDAAATGIHAPAHDATPDGNTDNRISATDCGRSARTARSSPAESRINSFRSPSPDSPRYLAGTAARPRLGLAGTDRDVGGTALVVADGLAHWPDTCDWPALATNAGPRPRSRRCNTDPGDAVGRKPARTLSADTVAAGCTTQQPARRPRSRTALHPPARRIATWELAADRRGSRLVRDPREPLLPRSRLGACCYAPRHFLSPTLIGRYARRHLWRGPSPTAIHTSRFRLAPTAKMASLRAARNSQCSIGKHRDITDRC